VGKADNLTTILCLNFLETSGPLQACNGNALPLPFRNSRFPNSTRLRSKLDEFLHSVPWSLNSSAKTADRIRPNYVPFILNHSQIILNYNTCSLSYIQNSVDILKRDPSPNGRLNVNMSHKRMLMWIRLIWLIIIILMDMNLRASCKAGNILVCQADQ